MEVSRMLCQTNAKTKRNKLELHSLMEIPRDVVHAMHTVCTQNYTWNRSGKRARRTIVNMCMGKMNKRLDSFTFCCVHLLLASAYVNDSSFCRSPFTNTTRSFVGFCFFLSFVPLYALSTCFADCTY